ncbi:matrixin family metalloprotease [Paraflavitalea speifideaquila]|uniref:matrixin family metalloprotease n=1 Tax=Paraflavitalea speifideaquila TaxID=3076558 RepID=UPI0028EA7DAB|nr:matrixin family metalloprotease [Paraflavitalea speifideiaquila]
MSALVLCCLVAFSCQQPTHPNRVVVIQPLGDFPSTQVATLLRELKKTHPHIITRTAIPFPASSWYAPGNRYRADSLIKYLNRLGNADTVIIGLTNKDISVTKDTIKDWGVMGFGYSPGNGCVVSSFRLTRGSQQDQFYKVAIHELGHTQGLPHCSVKTCFMRDAEGGNPLDEETDFCTDCKSFLTSKGWQLK